MPQITCKSCGEPALAGNYGFCGAHRAGVRRAAEVRTRDRDNRTDDAGWEAQLARLAAYKAEHGDCNVPKCWPDDPKLGAWVSTQRTGKWQLDRGEPSTKGMTAARAAKLVTALGFAWEDPKGSTDDADWEAQLARLVAYKADHGDCNVPGFNWAAGSVANDVARLATYKVTHGNCNVPHEWGWVGEDGHLASWVGTQRMRKRLLDRGEPSEGMTADRVARLTALGFTWECAPKAAGNALPNEAAWEAQLVRMTTYRAAHGDCDVPNLHADDLPLGRWVDKQRTLKRKLDHGEPCKRMTPERVAKLEALGFL
jgi:hypothetical protein